MKAGTLSPAVAQAAIEKAEEQVRAIERVQPAREEKETARVIRMLPRAAEVLRNRIRGGNLGLRDPLSIIPARNALFGMFGGKVPLRPAVTRAGEKPYLIARVALNREVLLQAAAQAANCLEFGSAHTPAPVKQAIRNQGRCSVLGRQLVGSQCTPVVS